MIAGIRYLFRENKNSKLIILFATIVLWFIVPIPNYIALLYMVSLYLFLGYFFESSIVRMVALLAALISLVAVLKSVILGSYNFNIVILFIPLSILLQFVFGCIFASIGAAIRVHRTS